MRECLAGSGWAQDENLGGCCPQSWVLGTRWELCAPWPAPCTVFWWRCYPPREKEVILTVAPCLSDYSMELLVWLSDFRGTGHLPWMLSNSPPLSRTCTWGRLLYVCWLSRSKHFAASLMSTVWVSGIVWQERSHSYKLSVELHSHRVQENPWTHKYIYAVNILNVVVVVRRGERERRREESGQSTVLNSTESPLPSSFLTHALFTVPVAYRFDLLPKSSLSTHDLSPEAHGYA